MSRIATPLPKQIQAAGWASTQWALFVTVESLFK
jgi:hypothetical protein